MGEHSGWAIKTIYKKLNNGIQCIPLNGSYPHLKSPHRPCGTLHNICRIPHEHAELRKGFTICGISSASLIGNFSTPAAEKSDFIFIILLFIVPTSLSYSFPFVPVETYPDGYLVGKELVILLFKCIVGKCFVVFYVFSFPPTVYVGTLNLIALIPGPSILTLIFF